VSWPAHIKDKGGMREQFVHVIDVVPKILEDACSVSTTLTFALTHANCYPSS
jgi:arylsulfatase A-like enzyme